MEKKYPISEQMGNKYPITSQSTYKFSEVFLFEQAETKKRKFSYSCTHTVNSKDFYC